MRPTTLLTFHAEALHRDEVWARVTRALGWMERASAEATFFVFPFPSVSAGVDIGDRVRALVDVGHEIGQHTHFYAGDRIAGAEKSNDLSDANVGHCIERDKAQLLSMGMQPRGFVAGAWLLTPGVLSTLVDSDFLYECSGRPPRGSGVEGNRELGWLSTTEVVGHEGRTLVRLPTACSLGEWFKSRRNLAADAPTEKFQIVYLHDYDLLRARSRYMLSIFLRLNGGRLGTVRELYERVSAEIRS